ncbi:hypothetical protein EV421DRAFT_1896456 [Armillaria borealis]|uniref:Uncharacterized protein n=1 Tax=Armillaria borealis TaxID=47425 RepID=A0AA39K560_9AGAR|nr:hypothetical protein EV421DRAFT_1896456 [Armillaria borealis]
MSPLPVLRLGCRRFTAFHRSLPRPCSVATRWRALSKAASTASQKSFSTTEPSEQHVYHGPLSNTFRRLKLFSWTTLGLTSTISPFMFVIESNLPASARLSLATIAVTTSAASTAIVGWVTHPYVTTLRRLEPPNPGGVPEIEMTTYSLALKPRITRVYDPDFIIDTSRPFAKWELAKSVALPVERRPTIPVTGSEETVAETMDSNGEVIGSWVVRWAENGEGTCRSIGSVVRHFNVHLELLR